MHDQITALFFWNSINVQIRIKAIINKSDEDFSNQHFLSRDKNKNALAISSNQSFKTDSLDDVKSKFNDTLKQDDLLRIRPKYWGGFSFIPYYFEFWQGHKSRLNKREVYELKNDVWKSYFLQP